MRMKVFVSQPHQERPVEEMQKIRDGIIASAKRYLKTDNVVEIPMIEPRQLRGQHPVYCLALNLQMMCQADVVIFEAGWWESRACCIQHDVCEQYEIEHIDLTFKMSE